MSYSINAVNHKNNISPAVKKALRAKEIRYKDLPPAVEVKVGWDCPNGGGTEWKIARWPTIPSKMVDWMGDILDECPAGTVPVVLLSSLENAGVTVKEVLSLARHAGFHSVRLVDE